MSIEVFRSSVLTAESGRSDMFLKRSGDASKLPDLHDIKCEAMSDAAIELEPGSKLTDGNPKAG
jgi:hypothetical protein